MSFKEKIIGAAIIAASWFGIMPNQASASTRNDAQGKGPIEKIFGINKGQLKRAYDRNVVDGTRRGVGKFVERTIQDVSKTAGSTAVQKTVEYNLRGLVNEGKDYRPRMSPQVVSQGFDNVVNRIKGGGPNRNDPGAPGGTQVYQERELSTREIAEAERAAVRAAEREAVKSGITRQSNQEYLQKVRTAKSGAEATTKVDTQSQDETKINSANAIVKKVTLFSSSQRE